MTTSGQHYTAEVPYHCGHYKDPMSDQEIEAKFRALAQDLLPPAMPTASQKECTARFTRMTSRV